MNKQYKEAKSNIILGVCCNLFAIIFYAETFRFKLREINNSVDAAFFPRLTACLVATCATIILVKGIASLRKIPREDRKELAGYNKKSKEGLMRIGEVFVVLLAVAITFRKLGFLLTAPWMMFFLFMILESKEKRNYKLYLLISIVAPIIVFLAFYYGFSTMLPMGFIRPWLLRILA